MSKTATKQPSPLVQAALALEEELRRMGTLSREAQRLPLDSERNLERTASKLAELGGADQRLQPLVQVLMAAVQGLVDVQQQEAASLAARAMELQKRRELYHRLEDMFQVLAQGSQQLNVLVQAFAEARRGTVPEGEAPTLDEVLDSMNTVIDGAAQLIDTAKQEDFQDIVRRAESLRQQLVTARSKLSHLVPAGEAAGKVLH
jgi:hypothetical protein